MRIERTSWSTHILRFVGSYLIAAAIHTLISMVGEGLPHPGVSLIVGAIVMFWALPPIHAYGVMKGYALPDQHNALVWFGISFVVAVLVLYRREIRGGQRASNDHPGV